ncbi:MAG: aldo/keto reductase, partial [Promethearchaeia archaeon]
LARATPCCKEQCKTTVPRNTVGSLKLSKLISCWQNIKGNRRDVLAGMRAHRAAGATTFFCADSHPESEQALGSFLAQEEKSREVQVCSTFRGIEGISQAQIMSRIKSSIKRLGTDSLDLVSLEFDGVAGSLPAFVRAAQHLADMKAARSIRELGVANCGVEQLAALSAAGVSVASNLMPLSILNARSFNVPGGLASYCKANKIKLLASGALAGGLLSDRFLGVAQATAALGPLRGSVGRELREDELLQELLAVLHEIGVKHGVSVANVALRYVLDAPAVGSVVVGVRQSSTVLGHVADARHLFTVYLDELDYEAINRVLRRAPPP